MARTFVAASSQFLSLASAFVTALPFTFVGWGKPSDLVGAHPVLVVGATATTDTWRLTQNNATVRAVSVAAGITVFAATGSLISTGAWQHFAATFTSITDRAAFYNGGNKATNATSNNPATPNQSRIGANYDAGVSNNFFNGDLAECAAWNIALADADIALLAAGEPAQQIQPQALIGVWPIWGNDSPEPDVFGTNAMTLNAGPAKASGHPPVLPVKGLLGMTGVGR